jgi:hypothetical protein
VKIKDNIEQVAKKLKTTIIPDIMNLKLNVTNFAIKALSATRSSKINSCITGSNIVNEQLSLGHFLFKSIMNI